MTLGSHAIVRLPAFLSAALMGIPGGGMFGMISRSFLEARGLFEDMPRLAERAIDRMFGPHWVRENPIAQVEVDTSECLYIDDIHANVKELHRRVNAQIETAGHPGQTPFDLATSRKLLSGLVPTNYTDVLLRFHPDKSQNETPDDPITKPMEVVADTPRPEDSGTLESLGDGNYAFTLHSERLGGLGDVPHPDLTIVAALKRMTGVLDDQLDPLTFDSDELRIERALPEHSTTVSAKVHVVGSKQRMTIQREYFDIDGERIAVGMATFVDQLRSTGTVTVEDNLLGEAIGYRMPVREPLEQVYGAADHDMFLGPALMSFAHRSLSAHGFFDEEVLPTTWTTRFGGSVAVGDHLHTYARKDSSGLVVTVVNDASFPVLQMRMSEQSG